jgi:hypothetical protein
MEVRAHVDTESPERLLIDIAYQIKATADRRSLVFPFYRIPGEEQVGPEQLGARR